jgi:hypothetical protein
MKYEYKGCQVAINTSRTAENKWKYDVLIEPEPHFGTSVDKLPGESFETEEEAIQAAKRAAEWRIDNPLVKPIRKKAG